MTSIVRQKPPVRPAGLERCDQGSVARWRHHSFRFPPYQYKSQYLIWQEDAQRFRFLNSQERELLMGFGRDHTSVCFSASFSKSHKQSFEDERMSLIGDSFACPSFMLLAAASGFPFTRVFDVQQMQQRLGLPPGYSAHISVAWPLGSSEHLHGMGHTSAPKTSTFFWLKGRVTQARMCASPRVSS